eukprot:2269314-Amphidinium_carterae.2
MPVIDPVGQGPSSARGAVEGREVRSQPISLWHEGSKGLPVGDGPTVLLRLSSHERVSPSDVTFWTSASAGNKS